MRYAIGKVSGVFVDHDVAVKFFGIRNKKIKAPEFNDFREYLFRNELYKDQMDRWRQKM